MRSNRDQGWATTWYEFARVWRLGEVRGLLGAEELAKGAWYGWTKTGCEQTSVQRSTTSIERAYGGTDGCRFRQVTPKRGLFASHRSASALFAIKVITHVLCELKQARKLIRAPSYSILLYQHAHCAWPRPAKASRRPYLLRPPLRCR